MDTFFNTIVFGHRSITKQQDNNRAFSITVSTVPDFNIFKELNNLVLLAPEWEQVLFDEDLMVSLFTMVSPITGEKKAIESWDESEDGKIISGGLGFSTFMFEIHEDSVRFYNPEGDMEISRQDCKDKSRFFFTKDRVYDNQTYPFSFNADLTIHRYIKTNLDFKKAVQDFLINFYMKYMKASYKAVFDRLVDQTFKHHIKQDLDEDLPF